MIYVDTSVIVAALDPEDPRRERAREALERHNGKVISELVLAELASVLARQHGVMASIRSRLGVSEHIAFIAVIIYVLKRFDLKYVDVKGFSRTMLGRLYKPLAYSIELAEKLRLKTLDLLHLAYIKAMKEQGIGVHTLLTADIDFKNREEDIAKTLKITVYLIR
ncbi:MAG: PIN domain nuclease [Hyperthermus sp.]|nr:MAG: PIN domain nuclease [Hyperthermus sp.]